MRPALVLRAASGHRMRAAVEGTMHSLSFDIHGLPVRIESADARLVDDVAGRFAYFAADSRDSGLHCSFEVVAGPEQLTLPRPAGEGRSVYEPAVGEMTYFSSCDELFVGVPRLQMLLRPLTMELRVLLCPGAEERWLATHSILAFALMESLKRRGVFSLHAAAIGFEAGAIVLAGPNGAGKSTLALALLTEATGFLGDDLVFLQAVGDGVQILPFPDYVGVTPETARLLPDVQRALGNPGAVPIGARKHEVSAAAVKRVAIPPRTAPRALVLVDPGSAGAYRLETAGQAEALAELAPNVLPTETRASQEHLNALATLVRACPRYRLRGRGDLKTAVELLEPLASSA